MLAIENVPYNWGALKMTAMRNGYKFQGVKDKPLIAALIEAQKA